MQISRSRIFTVNRCACVVQRTIGCGVTAFLHAHCKLYVVGIVGKVNENLTLHLTLKPNSNPNSKSDYNRGRFNHRQIPTIHPLRVFTNMLALPQLNCKQDNIHLQ